MTQKAEKIISEFYINHMKEKLKASAIHDSDSELWSPPLYYELRFYSKKEDGEFYPTKNGIKFSDDLLDEVMDVLNKFIKYQSKIEKNYERHSDKSHLKRCEGLLNICTEMEKLVIKEKKDRETLEHWKEEKEKALMEYKKEKRKFTKKYNKSK